MARRIWQGGYGKEDMERRIWQGGYVEEDVQEYSTRNDMLIGKRRRGRGNWERVEERFIEN
jgi:hypothetical protein